MGPIRKLALLLLVGASAPIVAACGGESARSPEDVPPDAVAVVGDREIPKSEFDALMEQAEKSYKAQKREFPNAGTPEYNDLRSQAIRYLVQRAEFELEAEEMGIEVTDEEIDKKLKEYVEQYAGGNEEKFWKQLEDQGVTQARVRDDIRMQVLQEKIYDRVTEDVKVTDEDVEKYYEENEELFKRPASREVRHILVKSEERANELHAQLQGGASFGALAKRFSQDPGTKKLGGKYQAVQGQSAPEFDKVAFELDKGEISEPVKTQFGWHVIQAVSSVKKESVTPFEEVEESIRAQLVQQEKNDAIKEWVESVKKEWESKVVYAVGYEPRETETGATETEEE